MHRIESDNYTTDSEGRKQFTDGPPGTTVNAAILNALQEELAYVIEQNGIALLNKANDTRTQLYSAIQSMTTTYYDYVVSSQYTFNNIIERVGANQYKIKDSYKSVFFKNLSGGYAFAGSLSPLSGGDTWGYLETNNCTTLHAEAGSYIDFGDTQGYIEVNTDDCHLTDIWVKGTGASAAAISQSFLLNAYRVTYDNCKTSNRLSNTSFSIFQGSGTALHNITSKYSNCSAWTLTSSGLIRVFYQCQNIINTYAYDITSTGSFAYGYSTCEKITNSQIRDIDSNANQVYGFHVSNILSNCEVYEADSTTTIYGFYDCDNLSNCKADDIDSSAGGATAFYSCYSISGGGASNITSATQDAKGYDVCRGISGIYIDGITGGSGSGDEAIGFDTCHGISGSYINDVIGNTSYGITSSTCISGCRVQNIGNLTIAQSRGYSSCTGISGCSASTIEGDISMGFSNCTGISGCYASTIDADTGAAYGFNLCSCLSACNPENISSVSGAAYGYYDCEYGSSLYTTEAANANNDWMDTNDAQIANQYSTPAIWT